MHQLMQDKKKEQDEGVNKILNQGEDYQSGEKEENNRK